MAEKQSLLQMYVIKQMRFNVKWVEDNIYSHVGVTEQLILFCEVQIPAKLGVTEHSAFTKYTSS